MSDDTERINERTNNESRASANIENPDPVVLRSLSPPSYTVVSGNDNVENTTSYTTIDDSSISHDSIAIGGRRNSRNDSTLRDEDDNPLMSTESTMSGNVSVNAEGHIGANVGYSQQERIGDQTTSRSISAGGFIDVNENLEFEGFGGNVSVGQGDTTVTVGGAYVVRAEEPKPDGNRYYVSWTRSYSGSLGGSSRREGIGGSGVDASLSATAGASRSIEGKRYFDTREAAQQFYEGRTWVGIDPSDASQLGQGDTLTQTSGESLGSSGSLSAGGLSVGGSLSVGHRHSVEITGMGDDHIRVKIMDASILGAGANISGTLISMGVSVESVASSGVIVNFDLSTEEGRNSFSYLRAMGTLSPSGGYSLHANVQGEEMTETTSVGLAGASVSIGNRTSHQRTEFEDGGFTDEREGEQSVGMTMPLGLGSYSESDKLQITFDSRTQERTYSVNSNVNSSSAESVNRDLARSTGFGFDGNVQDHSDQGNRQWSLTSSFSQQQIRQLKREIDAGNFNYQSLIFRSGYGLEFLRTVRSTNNLDTIASALAEFISETGDDGLNLIRNTLNIRPMYGIELAGDPYLTGESGHQALSERINQFTEMIESPENNSRSVIGTSINRELTRQRQRLLAISDMERYPELPSGLRDMEINRTRDEIRTLEGLLGRARNLPRAVNEQDATQENLSEQQSNVQEQEPPTPSLDQQHTALFNWANEKRAECVEMGNIARRDNWVHHGAYATTIPAYEEWGERHWYGDGENADLYDEAHAYLRNGNNAWETAQTSWNEYREMLNNAEFSDGMTEGVIGKLRQAGNAYSRSKTSFMLAHRKFEQIRNLHLDHPGMFEGYRHLLPDYLTLE